MWESEIATWLYYSLADSEKHLFYYNNGWKRSLENISETETPNGHAYSLRKIIIYCLPTV